MPLQNPNGPAKLLGQSLPVCIGDIAARFQLKPAATGRGDFGHQAGGKLFDRIRCGCVKHPIQALAAIGLVGCRRITLWQGKFITILPMRNPVTPAFHRLLKTGAQLGDICPIGSLVLSHSLLRFRHAYSPKRFLPPPALAMRSVKSPR